MSADRKERTCLMKRFIAIIAATIATVSAVASCSKANTTETIEVPFGNDELLAALEEADIEPASDDFIIQSFEENVNIYREGEKKSEKVTSLKATFFSLESYNLIGESIQSGYGYVFHHNSEAAEYYAYVSGSKADIAFEYLNAKTIWFERGTGKTYKQDTVAMLNDNLFNSSNTYVSIPYLTDNQAKFTIPEDHSIEKCKG